MTADDLKTASLEGRQAKPGSRNPYADQYALARAWRLGYTAMLTEMLRDSPAARPSPDASPVTTNMKPSEVKQP